MDFLLTPVPSGLPSPSLTAVRRPISPTAPVFSHPKPPRRTRQRRSYPPDGILSASARRRRLFRGATEKQTVGADNDDDHEWCSDDSDGSQMSSSAQDDSSDSDAFSSGDDTVGAIVRRARSTRLRRGVGTFRVVSTPNAPRRRFPSFASSLNLSPVRKNAPTPMSSPVKSRLPSFSPFGGRTRLFSSSSALSMTPLSTADSASSVVLDGPNFSPSIVVEEGDSSFLSEQDTISFIYEPSVISDAFSKGNPTVLEPGRPALRVALDDTTTTSLTVTPSLLTPTRVLSPHAAPFVFGLKKREVEDSPCKGASSLSDAKKWSYRGLRIVNPDAPSSEKGEGRSSEHKRKMEEVKRMQESGEGGSAIAVMIGPESLPYARNPSGVDGSVLDSSGRLNVWTRSPEDPEPEHVDYLHFQRRPGAPNPAARVLADDDLPESAYRRPSVYAVPSTGVKPVFKAARPRVPEMPPATFVARQHPSHPSFPVDMGNPKFIHPRPEIQVSQHAHPVGPHSFQVQPSAVVLKSAEDLALHSILEKLHRAEQTKAYAKALGSMHTPFTSPTFQLVSPGSSFTFSSSPSSEDFSPFSAGASPVFSLTNFQAQALRAEEHQRYLLQQRELEELKFLSRLAGYMRPFHDPILAPPARYLTTAVGPVDPNHPQVLTTYSPSRPSSTQVRQVPASSQVSVVASESLVSHVGLSSTAQLDVPHQTHSHVRQSGRREPTLSPVKEHAAESSFTDYQPNSRLHSQSNVTPTDGTPAGVLHEESRPSAGQTPSSFLERADEVVFLPAGKGVGFANGGARRPGPGVHGPPRSLGRRALESMDVAVGRERQSTSILERERLAVLRHDEIHAARSTPIIVVGDMRRSQSEGPDEATSPPRRKSGRWSLPGASRAPGSRDAKGKEGVMTVGSLAAMFTENESPSRPSTISSRPESQRRVVSEPTKHDLPRRPSSNPWREMVPDKVKRPPIASPTKKGSVSAAAPFSSPSTKLSERKADSTIKTSTPKVNRARNARGRNAPKKTTTTSK